jgi:hypothetical protein
MNRIWSLAAICCIAIGPAFISGCERMSDSSPESQGSFAGGDGAFGESPESPGYYPSQHSRGAVLPTTQPACTCNRTVTATK